ncbi:molybdate ABC transporter substrate-binding protein [Crocosphaera sp. XPORK-15E]|uniref:molybdate ABC transporter substrate-binding protein n=1 Tax=Crocosphaera sp. XPORK-15E TaxID=3110247 RepID=UPI002B20C4FB|nr:molybdate ABC transporter substrate-binding protein [Crocosphaera sp. XPORK-15E]MEA5535968.1 molybdate ABC transporter substrate-binding protein [Crocosphaera sp. XPORK-15E]
MKRKHFIALSLAAFVTACTASNSNQKDTPKVTLTVSVAASVQDAMKAIQPIYQTANPNIDIVYNFGSSGSLQQQIEQGAPTDIFISAAPKQMNALQQKDLILTETRKNLLENQVVLVTPKDFKETLTFETLGNANLDKIALGEPTSVPAGQYAKEVLTSLKSFDKLTSKLVFAKDVRQVLFYVETGNVDAGIVYGTDAKISDKVKIAATAPEGSHAPIVYPVAVVKDSKNPEEAMKFVDFLLSDQGKKVFEEYGFTIPNN